MDPNLTAIYELLIDQQKSIRDLKLQVEGLKNMMFEHKPAFAELHAAQVARLSGSTMMKASEQRITLMESLLENLQETVS